MFWRQKTSDLGSAVVNKNKLTMMMMIMMKMMIMMEMFTCRKIPMFLIKLRW